MKSCVRHKVALLVTLIASSGFAHAMLDAFDLAVSSVGWTTSLCEAEVYFNSPTLPKPTAWL